jgi:hypothetical protein
MEVFEVAYNVKGFAQVGRNYPSADEPLLSYF